MIQYSTPKYLRKSIGSYSEYHHTMLINIPNKLCPCLHVSVQWKVFNFIERNVSAISVPGEINPACEIDLVSHSGIAPMRRDIPPFSQAHKRDVPSPPYLHQTIAFIWCQVIILNKSNFYHHLISHRIGIFHEYFVYERTTHMNLSFAESRCHLRPRTYISLPCLAVLPIHHPVQLA